jgi:hypothetical protein
MPLVLTNLKQNNQPDARIALGDLVNRQNKEHQPSPILSLKDELMRLGGQVHILTMSPAFAVEEIYHDNQIHTWMTEFGPQQAKIKIAHDHQHNSTLLLPRIGIDEYDLSPLSRVRHPFSDMGENDPKENYNVNSTLFKLMQILGGTRIESCSFLSRGEHMNPLMIAAIPLQDGYVSKASAIIESSRD